MYEPLDWILSSQFPTTPDTEQLYVDVDGYKIINIYKPPPTRLQTSELPPLTPVYTMMILIYHILIGDITRVLTGIVWLHGQTPTI